MMNMTRLLLLAAVLSLAACGFHVRGSNLKDVTFAFKSLYLKAPVESPFVKDLRKALKANKVNLVKSPDQAELVLEVVSEQATRQILSLTGAGRVQEYQLFYRVSLRAYDSEQNDWLPTDEISLSRILPWDDTQVLSKEQEAAGLNKDMRSDAVGQAVRRLNRARPPTGTS
ncbi:LPS-assembly lipoprotein LptE [mine drainage metagenome]|uniref:LPS-assembly lipoprotein LptE n=1 Tax=mine drainage metagenome TaxID=410659 RepID=A0A1J5S907_9ZZZZ